MPTTTSTADAGARRGSDPVAYDFRRPAQMSRETTRLLDMVYETVARQWSILLGSALRTSCSVQFVRVEQLTYDHYVSSMDSPTLLAVFDPEPHAGPAFLQLALEAGYVAVDRMLGGPGGPQPTRAATEIEVGLLSRLIERLLAELRYSLTAVNDLEPALRVLEFNPQFVQVAAPSDLFAVARFDVTVAGTTTAATVAFPIAVLTPRAVEPNTAERDRERAAGRERARALMTDLVHEVEVDVSARFTPLPVPSRRILELRVGDVLALDHPVDRPLDVVSSGVVCARGVAGTHGPRAALLIVSPAPTRKASA